MKEPDIEMNLKKIMERIKWIRETKAILSKEEISLSIPLMQDLSQVGNIYDKFMSYHAGRNSTMVRKQFIFVILYLYSPSALGGSKMRRGLREKIAKVLEKNEEWRIQMNNGADAWSLFIVHYKLDIIN